MKIKGNLVINEGEKTDYSKLTEVSGYIYVSENASFTAPALTKSGYIYVSENASFTAPALTKSGYIYVSENASFTAPALTKSGSIDVSESAAFTAPALTKSGYIYVSENASFTAPALTCRANTAVFSGKKHKILHNDGLCFYAESERTSKGIRIYSGFVELTITDGTATGKKGYLVEKECFSAHATTLKEAITDLNFKIVAEKLAKEPIYADTIVSIQHYRLVTGACEFGCQQWLKQNNIQVTELPAKELLPILEKTNAYGLAEFKQLIQF